MRLIQLSAILLPTLLLSACGGGGDPAPAKPSSEAAAAQTPAAAPVTAAHEDLAPLFGTWALDPKNCGGQVLKISQSKFEGPGGGCDITSFTDNSDGSYTAAMSCGAAGKTASEDIKMRPIFAPTGEGIDLVYLNRDNLAATVLRCPTPKSN
ncbi:MAG: hypothetical protein ABIQ30_09295 [Devosia sp.]